MTEKVLIFVEVGPFGQHMNLRTFLDPSCSTARSARKKATSAATGSAHGYGRVPVPPFRSPLGRTLRLTLWLCLAVLVLDGLAVGVSEAFEVTVREVGSSTLNEAELVTKSPGDTVTIEFVVDTGGLELWGYSFGLAFSPSTLSALSPQRSNLAPLIPLGSPAIDASAGTLLNFAQAGFFSGLIPGVYVVETLTFTVDTIPSGGIDLVPSMSPSESFIVGGDTCPGTIPGCVATLYPMKIVSSPSVPTLSPLGVIFMIGLLLSTSLWTLGNARRSLKFMGRNGGSALTLFTLAFVSFASAPLASAAADKTSGKPAVHRVLDASSPKLVEDWGIEVVALRQSGAKKFLDFRYRVVDEEKASVLFGPKVKPVLVDTNTGHTLKVPTPPKLGPMKATRSQPKLGRVYFIFFANPGGTTEPGHEVSVDFGPLTITGIKLQ